MKIYQIEGFGYTYDWDSDGYNNPVSWFTFGVYADRSVAEEDCEKLNRGYLGDVNAPDSSSNRSYAIYEAEVLTSSYYPERT